MSNAEQMERQIRRLETGHYASPQQLDYQALWDHAQEILQLFKTVSPLEPSDRERLWQQFDAVCQEARRKQRNEEEKRKRQSGHLKQWILDEVEKARPPRVGLPEEQRFKDMGQALQHATFLFSKHKESMLGDHRLECLARLEEVEPLFQRCDLEMQKDRRRRHREARLKIGENLERNHARLQQAEEGLDRLRHSAEELRLQIDMADNPVFRHRLESKLAETAEKINNLVYSIGQIESWIEADKRKLQTFPRQDKEAEPPEV